MFERKNRLSRLFTLLILIFAGFFLASNEVKAYDWTEPTAAPTGGNLAVPLNPSGLLQTKFGSLILGDTNNPGLLTLTPGIFPVPGPGTCAEGQLAYRQADQKYYYCLGTAWKALTGGTIFQLNTEAQTGWGYIKGDSSARQYALMGQGRSNLPSYGVQGFAGFASPRSRGIYGFDSDFPLAYAGAFKGGVKIKKGASNPTQLTLGTSAEPVKLCLNNSGCLTDWPASGTGDPFWKDDNGPQVYLTPDTSNVSLGNVLESGVFSESDARFFVRTGEQKGVVIGKAVATNPYTCGDGICQTWESLVSCPQDCQPVCGNGICESPTETCGSCSLDCNGKQGSAGGCNGNNWCCDEMCQECCVGSTGQCPAGQECRFPGICQTVCSTPAQCGGAGWMCCSGDCKKGNCCQKLDCDIMPYDMCVENKCSQCNIASDCSRFGLNRCCTSPLSGVKYCGQCCLNTDCPVSKPECCFVGDFLKCLKAGSCGGGSGCFLAGTKILLADNSLKPIEAVKVGDTVYGYQDGQLKVAKVTQTFKHPNTSQYYILILENGQTLKVTGIHPIFNGKEYVKVEDLKIGDTVFIRDHEALKPTKVKSISLINQSVEVYNLEVDQTNNYFAEGVLVHNKVWPRD